MFIFLYVLYFIESQASAPKLALSFFFLIFGYFWVSFDEQIHFFKFFNCSERSYEAERKICYRSRRGNHTGFKGFAVRPLCVELRAYLSENRNLVPMSYITFLDTLFFWKCI